MRRRRPAPLDVAEHRHPRLHAEPVLDLAAQERTDAAERHVPELIQPDRLRDRLLLPLRPGSLGDHDDAELLPPLVARPEVPDDLVDVERDLRYEDLVGPARDPGHGRNPPGMPAHHLHHHDPVMRLRRRVEAIDRLGDDRDGSIEPEGVVGRSDVVIDGLRDTHHRDTHLREPVCDTEGIFAADRDQRIDTESSDVVQQSLHVLLVLEGVRPRRPEDRSPFREDPRHRVVGERFDVPDDQTAPSVPYPDRVKTMSCSGPHDRPDHRVQARTVPSARQYAYRRHLITFPLCRSSSPHPHSHRRG